MTRYIQMNETAFHRNFKQLQKAEEGVVEEVEEVVVAAERECERDCESHE